MTTYVFTGQGAQKRGMGRDLFDNYSELMTIADTILGYSLKELCLLDPENKLDQTQYTQPAIFTVNALAYLKEIEKNKVRPNYLAGHSLGEYNALFAASAFDFKTGLKLVKKRGELMSRAYGGGMAAVIGLSSTRVETVLSENGFSQVGVANHNSPSQTVIAGPAADIENAKLVFNKARCKAYIPLAVSGAFHTFHMQDVVGEFSDFLKDFHLSALTIPVISNVHAKPYEELLIRQNLVDQIISPVKWNDSIRYLLGKGETEFNEVGPSKVLTKLINEIKKNPYGSIMESGRT